jgi:hypothetical protein
MSAAETNKWERELNRLVDADETSTTAMTTASTKTTATTATTTAMTPLMATTAQNCDDDRASHVVIDIDAVRTSDQSSFTPLLASFVPPSSACAPTSDAANAPSSLSAVTLPADLLHKVMTFLPFDGVAECVCVCQRWHDTIKSPRMLSLLNSVSVG